MDNRQCVGLDKFHGYLSTLFPSRDDAAFEPQNCDNDGGSEYDAPDVKQGSSRVQYNNDGFTNSHSLSHRPTTTGDNGNGNDNASVDPGVPDAETETGTPPDGTDRRIVRRHRPVKFTKNAVEMLRETLNAFLRRVGTELAEVDAMSITPEEVVRALVSIDDLSHSAETESSDENDDSAGVANTDNDSTRSAPPTMKQLVSQAQHLLLMQKQQERQERQEAKQRKIDIGPNGDGETAGSVAFRSTKSSSHYPEPASSEDATTAAESRGAGEQTNKPSASGQKKRKRKPKTKITAEMEAEQERLLNASKQAFQSSQQ